METIKPVTEYTKLEIFGLSNDDCQHKKVIDIFDEESFKSLSVLKNDQGFAKLVQPFQAQNWRQQKLHSPLIRLAKQLLTTSCASAIRLKKISKGSSYYRRVLLLHKPKDTATYKAKMEKRLVVTLKQVYVNRITTMLNSGMIPPGNSDKVHRFLLGKTMPCAEESKLGWLLQAVLQSYRNYSSHLWIWKDQSIPG